MRMVKFGDPRFNRPRAIQPEAIAGGISTVVFRANFRLELVSDVLPKN